MANAGTAALTTDQDLLYQDPKGCTSFCIVNLSTSIDDALICIPSLHGTDFFRLIVGDKIIFRNDHKGIKAVKAKSIGTSTVYFGVVAQTDGF
jgi:hypothetical protein